MVKENSLSSMAKINTPKSALNIIKQATLQELLTHSFNNLLTQEQISIFMGAITVKTKELKITISKFFKKNKSYLLCFLTNLGNIFKYMP